MKSSGVWAESVDGSTLFTNAGAPPMWPKRKPLIGRALSTRSPVRSQSAGRAQPIRSRSPATHPPVRWPRSRTQLARLAGAEVAAGVVVQVVRAFRQRQPVARCRSLRRRSAPRSTCSSCSRRSGVRRRSTSRPSQGCWRGGRTSPSNPETSGQGRHRSPPPAVTLSQRQILPSYPNTVARPLGPRPSVSVWLMLS